MSYMPRVKYYFKRFVSRYLKNSVTLSLGSSSCLFSEWNNILNHLFYIFPLAGLPNKLSKGKNSDTQCQVVNVTANAVTFCKHSVSWDM